MPSDSTQRVILIAHSSGTEDDDLRWKNNLLSLTRPLIPNVQLDMFLVSSYSGKAVLPIDTEASAPAAILPLCLSNGFFAKQVIPSLLRPYREHITMLPSTADFQNDLWELLKQHAFYSIPHEEREQTDLLLISHGTRSNKTTTTEPEETLHRHIPGFNSYRHIFLNDHEASEKARSSKNLLILPKFLTRGKHVTRDIPAMLNLPMSESPFGRHQTEEGTRYYAEPIGEHPLLARLIASIIRLG